MKRRYKRASKSNFTQGLAKLEHRERVLDTIGEQQIVRDAIDDPSSDEDDLSTTAPEVHHKRSHTTRNKVQLAKWLHKNKKDPACKVGSRITIIEHT